MAKHIPGPLYFQQQGTVGVPMLFLHSTPDDHRLWLFQTAKFSSWFRTIAVDLAGYGRSSAPQAGVTIADQAEACWETVDRIAGGSPVIIHGNSMGSMIAKHMVQQRTDRVLALIVSGTGYLPSRESMVRWKQRYQSEGLDLRYKQCLDHFSPPAQARKLVQYYAEMVNDLNNIATVSSIIAMNEALAMPDSEDLYRSIKVPTLIISGSADRNHASAQELQSHIKDAEFRVVEGAGHAVMQEEPWTYDTYCIEFLHKHGLFPATAGSRSGHTGDQR